MNDEPKTVVEQLDSAETGEEWGAIFLDWFDSLRSKEEEQ